MLIKSSLFQKLLTWKILLTLFTNLLSNTAVSQKSTTFLFMYADLGAGKQNKGVMSGDADAGNVGRPTRVAASPRQS